MNPWYSTPNTMPAPLTDYNVRIRYWFGKPFLARYDADNEVWISNSNGLTYPVWSISRFQLPEDFPVTSFVLPLSSSGDGSEVSTLQLTFSAATSLKISGTGLFYDDAAGTINPGNVRFADSGSIQTFYIRVPSGSCTINIVNGLDLITQFNEFSTETNSPAIGDLLLSNLPVNLTYFRCYGSNTITGDITNLPVNLTHFYCRGSNTITGDISNLPVNLTFFLCVGSNTITGDISNLPVNLYYFYCTGSNTISSYTSRFWSTKPGTFILIGLSSLSSTDVDQLLIDFDADLTWSAGNKITITGNCGARTAASDAAVANMESEGAEISTN